MRITRISILAIVAWLTMSVAAADTPAPEPSARSADGVLELRQYTLLPGKRDVLIDLFERNFVESQEQCGMRIIGQFRDLDRPEHFVWLRSFVDMARRPKALSDFYFGPVWQEHRGVANGTMIDSDNVLLLRPARPNAGFAVTSEERRPASAQGPGQGLISANIVYLRKTTRGSFVEHFEGEVRPILEQAGASVIAELVSEDSANNFPRLAIRENEQVFVWFSKFPDTAAFERYRRSLAASEAWRTVAAQLSIWTYQPIETLRLEPTARSLLHG